MDLVSVLRIGLQGLAVHKVRAALSMLGIIFGVASVVAVIAVSEGARGEVLKQLAALGANNIIVRGIDWRADNTVAREKKKAARLRSDGLTVREADAVAASCDLFIAHAPLRRVFASVRRGETAVAGDVVGTTPPFLKVMNFNLREGRWLNASDEGDARRVCVIEDAIRQEIFKTASAVGEVLVIDQEPYIVVGVLESKVSTDEKFDKADIKALNRRIYIPLAAALLRTTREPLADEVHEVKFQVKPGFDIYQAEAFLSRFYETAHRMENVQKDNRDYQVLVAQDLLKQVEQSQNIFNVVMLCSAGISLLVGGIGIMNIMLANVTERRREVGIRRAVGATQGDILKQFLFESLIICSLGGLAGCVLGIIFTYAVALQTEWATSLPWWGMFAAVGVSLLDGVCFGTFPAWKAAKLDPIEALRYE
ncbi:MAG: ABC transporter permease [Planctomycetota bacterium]|nr:ABC transporter permease [Planctomycetota bacterium]